MFFFGHAKPANKEKRVAANMHPRKSHMNITKHWNYAVCRKCQTRKWTTAGGNIGFP